MLNYMYYEFISAALFDGAEDWKQVSINSKLQDFKMMDYSAGSEIGTRKNKSPRH